MYLDIVVHSHVQEHVAELLPIKGQLVYLLNTTFFLIHQYVDLQIFRFIQITKYILHTTSTKKKMLKMKNFNNNFNATHLIATTTTYSIRIIINFNGGFLAQFYQNKKKQDFVRVYQILVPQGYISGFLKNYLNIQYLKFS